MSHRKQRARSSNTSREILVCELGGLKLSALVGEERDGEDIAGLYRPDRGISLVPQILQTLIRLRLTGNRTENLFRPDTFSFDVSP